MGGSGHGAQQGRARRNQLRGTGKWQGSQLPRERETPARVQGSWGEDQDQGGGREGGAWASPRADSSRLVSASSRKQLVPWNWPMTPTS